MNREEEHLQVSREIETEITEALALLGRWSHLYEKLNAKDKQAWKAVVARTQGSEDRLATRAELDNFINTTLRPLVERLD
jgi:hypothetical protein